MQEPKTQTKVMVAEKDAQREIQLVLLELVELRRKTTGDDWRAAELIHRLSEYGITDAFISNRLVAHDAGMSRPTVTKYRVTYDYFFKQLDLGSFAKRFPVSTMYEARKVFLAAHATRSEVKSVLEPLVGLPANEVIARIREHYGWESEKRDFASIKLERGLYEQIKEVAARLEAGLRRRNFHGEITPQKVVELLVRAVWEYDADQLAALWVQEHGGEA